MRISQSVNILEDKWTSRTGWVILFPISINTMKFICLYGFKRIKRGFCFHKYFHKVKCLLFHLPTLPTKFSLNQKGNFVVRDVILWEGQSPRVSLEVQHVLPPRRVREGTSAIWQLAPSADRRPGRPVTRRTTALLSPPRISLSNSVKNGLSEYWSVPWTNDPVISFFSISSFFFYHSKCPSSRLID